MYGFTDLCDIVFEHSLTKAAGMQRPDLLMSGKVAPSGVTSKPAIEGHFKTGQRTNTLDDLVLPYWLSVWQHRLMASPMPVL
jgi:hypothetical protein